MAAIRLALVNDYEVVVRGLEAMLRSYRDAVEIVELDLHERVSTEVDIALYDTFAAAQGDAPVVRRMLANPRIGQVVVYSWALDPDLIASTLAGGVAAYLSKALPASRLVAALTAVHAGRQVSVPARASATAAAGGDWPGREEGLTQRESEVLALITQGLGNTDIAERAHLSINSVKTHIRGCYRRIGVTTRAQAVLWGIDHGFRPDRGRFGPLAIDPDA